MKERRYAVLFRKPSTDKLEGLSCSEKHQVLQQHSSQRIERLLEWLEDKELSSQVSSVGPKTIFDVIFLSATENVKNALSQNPEVEEITEAPELDVHLTVLS